MHSKPIINILLGVFVIILVIGAYYLGITSKNEANLFVDKQTATVPVLTQEQLRKYQFDPQTAGGKNQTPTVKQVQTIPTSQTGAHISTSPSWHTAFNLSGESNTTTASFQMRGAHWRATLSCTPLGEVAGVSVAIMGDGSENIGESERFGEVVDECPPTHTFDFYHHTPGLYSVSTIVTNARYTIKIEDFY